ncbi:SDR family oxidoreductase [Patescibacteria group bacterium]|nr:SDR family oxidoreductase [Patescibacteria group bacterium]
MKKNKFNHILITGGAGYVGVPTVSLLLEQGYKVRVFDNLSWGGGVLLPFLSNPSFDFIKSDVRNKNELVFAFKDIDAVIHLAGIVGFPACRKYPKESRQINVDGTQNVVELANGKIPIIFASTGSTYGKVNEQFCAETTPLNPLSSYGKQKAEAEDVVKVNKNYIIYRFATAFGVAPRMRLDLLINDFTFRAVNDKTLVVYEKNFMRTFIHARDMARSFLFALENFEKMNGEIYNVGDERLNISKEDVCLLIQKYVDVYLHFVEVGHDIDQRDYMVDYSKIKRLGYEGTITIEQGIKELTEAASLIEIKNPYSNV